MKSAKKLITSGIYLVIDPAMDEELLLNKLQLIVTKKIAAVQIWDNFKKDQNRLALILKICSLCKDAQTPVLINNHWEYLKVAELDGVHFDGIPANFNKIKSQISPDVLFGLTCGNDLAAVRWAATNNMDYISFCALFPSSSAAKCEVVSFETIKEAALIFGKPLFLAGGIQPHNLKQLDELKYDGIAVISGIMNSEHPDNAIDKYRQNLKTTK